MPPSCPSTRCTSQPGSFQSANARDRFVDLLFSVERRDIESQVLVYVLFEHQSSDDWFMPLRMLQYMMRIWDSWIERTNATRPPLPLILPVVLAHDERGWRAPQRFHDLFADDPGTRAILERFVPSFEFALDDLAKLSDTDLAARELPPATALSLWALR
ncbi:MAG: Rpn family recombination-promoting nuclease/putative transposase, partial [Nannocystaceae bacterium]|nr:Rpn family recombination-promoting nuclease/putative transposase [Nannocystaceae bacterium]